MFIRPTGRARHAEIIDKDRKHYEPDELRRFFAQFRRSEVRHSPYWHAYFYTQYYYGTRVSEVALLLKEDVDFSANKIIIRRLKKKPKEDTPHGFSETVYAIQPNLMRVLTEAREYTDEVFARLGAVENSWFFPSLSRRRKRSTERLSALRTTVTHDEKPCFAVSRSTATDAFRRLATMAGVPEKLRHAHVLRHTRATLLLAAGAQVGEVQHLLGHESPRTTEGYLGIARDMRLRIDAIGKLGDVDVDDS